MDTEPQLRHAVKEITQDGTFRLKQLSYDDKNFGNKLVILTSKMFDLKLVSDRGDMRCEIKIPCSPPEWFLLGDVITALGIPAVKYSRDFSEFTRVVTNLIKKRRNELETAVRQENLQVTMKRIREIINQRIKSTYGDVQLD